MHEATSDARWESLIRLLAPFSDQAMATARRLCRSRADGDDLFSETVVRAQAKLMSLRDERKFRSWFYAVLLSVHRSRSRRAFWRRCMPIADLVAAGRDPVGDDGRRGEEEHVRAERASRALATLPAVQREAVVLHDIDGFSMAEIAAMQGVTVSAVKTRVARGRERLRAHYRRLGLAGPADGHRRWSAAPDGVDTAPAGVRTLAPPGLRRLDRWGALLDNWETTDSLGGRMVGPWAAAQPAGRLGTLERLAGRRNPWLRRLALVGSVYLGRRPDAAVWWPRVEGIVLALAGHRGAAIPKAISWVLRSHAGRCPGEVADFLRRHEARLPAIALREARHQLATGYKTGRPPG